MLCPDPMVSAIYGDLISTSAAQVNLVLAHGYAVYSGELRLSGPHHQALLLAPNAIGPKLLQNFRESFPNSHRLIAAFSASSAVHEDLVEIAVGLGFSRSSLVQATFDEETMGDLMSEQGLLCGGVFNLLEWTMEAMANAGIPDALIREECLTELELIASMIRERGPAKTFQAISQVAQCGTIAMKTRLEDSGFKESFMAQMKSVQTREFPKYFRSKDWNQGFHQLAERLSSWEKKLNKGETNS
jgi:ketol-acid reductoisomerase